MIRSFFAIPSIVGLVTGVVGCGNQVQFSEQLLPTQLIEAPSAEIPSVILPPPETPNPVPPPAPRVTLKTGTCGVGGEKILGCLNCESTQPIPAPPVFSRKGQALWDLMVAACSIPNKSNPAGYTAPTREQILQRIIQCSPDAYPDSSWMGTQQATITRLLNDPSAQRKAFGGLYYNSASTDFETYFGLDIGEARYTFCFGQASFGTQGVYPKEYYDAWYDGGYYTLPPIYVRAQTYRSQLRNCLASSLQNPNRPALPGTPGKTCGYKSAEGEMSEALVQTARQWIAEGHEVFFEGLNQCGVMSSPESYLDEKGLVKLAVKYCQ
jgi:hypothetical protein